MWKSLEYEQKYHIIDTIIEIDIVSGSNSYVFLTTQMYLCQCLI